MPSEPPRALRLRPLALRSVMVASAQTANSVRADAPPAGFEGVRSVALVAPHAGTTVGTLRPASIESVLTEHGIEVRRFDTGPTGLEGKSRAALARELYAVIRSCDAVIISVGPFAPLSVAVPIARALGRRIITDWRDPWIRLLEEPEWFNRRYSFRVIEQMALASSDEVWVVNEPMRAAYSPLARRGLVRVIPNGHGLSPNEVAELAAARPSLRRTGRAIYTGTMHAYRSNQIAAGCVELRRLFPGLTELVVAGSVSDAELSQVEDALPGVDIAVHGQVPYEDLHALIATAEVGLVLVRNPHEHVPTKCYDYLAAGVPLVLSHSGSLAVGLFEPWVVQPGRPLPEIAVEDRNRLSRRSRLRSALVPWLCERPD